MSQSTSRTQAQQDLVLDALRRAWAHQPHQRLGQLIANVTKQHPFYVEDDDLMALLDGYEGGR